MHRFELLSQVLHVVLYMLLSWIQFLHMLYTDDFKYIVQKFKEERPTKVSLPCLSYLDNLLQDNPISRIRREKKINVDLR